MINLGVGRVDILLVDALRARVEQSATEAHHLSADAYPREDDAPGIAVDEFATIVLVADARLQDELLLVALAQRLSGQGTSVLKVVAELELADDVVAETATCLLYTSPSPRD